MNQPSQPTCDQLHQQAMDAANSAVDAERRGEMGKAQEQFAKAFQLEKQAAMTLAYNFSAEPSRSVLFRSAASLALKAKKYQEAERMAAFGLIGNPPGEIVGELRAALSESLSYLKKIAA